VDEEFLFEKGLTNYWGYSSIGYLAPHAGYSSTGTHGQQLREFKEMVKALHASGIEVILDVVYNHTAEGNHLGPMLSFKGVDNATYYRLSPEDPHFFMDYTGTGNTLNTVHNSVLRLIMDSLRYFVIECHVDGFRFDLASALARGLYDVDRLHSFFDTIHQDPVLSQVKLIAEPWDVGPGGYQVGNFPVLWSEWNAIYRDVVRDFWRGEEGVADFASRFTGSSDLYQDDGRRPFASINFITAHDGFTLHDLVTYNAKHNEANLEDNQDGTDDNRSWNCGAEGPTDDPAVRALRAQQQRNFLATMLLSQGVPMICHGDELGRTQQGNNNGFCHDDELTWIDWSQADTDLIAYVSRVAALRARHPIFRRRRFFEGRPSRHPEAQDVPDIAWFRPDGSAMHDEDWDSGFGKSVGVYLNGEAISETDARGERIEDDSFILYFNAHDEPIDFMLPTSEFGTGWQLELDTSALDADADAAGGEYAPGDSLKLSGRSLVLLRRHDLAE
ncbi:glycogen debranching protein GlgX, partial [Jatrophihabitans sp.]|uniref:glycogen debranching protein GlgX n=1 Tax=Jatrophihabitans sp. TaxID=1932789 RepID=UPI0030C66CE3|nr:glycogen debranching protein [Jatrophihabitans sp.]